VGVDPCLAGKILGNCSISDALGAIWPKIPESFGRHSYRFPVIRNREFISMSREIPGNEAISNLKRESLTSSRSKTSLRDENSTDLGGFSGETSRSIYFGFRSAEPWHTTGSDG
jgi:hypothetical protein